MGQGLGERGVVESVGGRGRSLQGAESLGYKGEGGRLRRAVKGALL